MLLNSNVPFFPHFIYFWSVIFVLYIKSLPVLQMHLTDYITRYLLIAAFTVIINRIVGLLETSKTKDLTGQMVLNKVPFWNISNIYDTIGVTQQLGAAHLLVS